ncbi:hypothetical protein PGN35_021515 [Nodosilinea sp. PGN35]|uniref:hypothetical protein n=1 Tax=Nodosilinea sp. PGN35 TaxID=3020489 RepID=UPI0023B2F0A8|nr:hypothetical protein [Nodosilinea sp. TSF1-S3]MDF0366937.1 hypothetical protein [Nodosilinea sp. TSF1-S3]
MTDTNWPAVSGTVQQGHTVASGSASASPYPSGTIEMQTPYFEALGLDLAEYFKGTLNISISPSTFQLINPEFTFRQVEWTDQHPPEDFSFSRCRILFQGAAYDCWIYYPHPETKQRNFQNPSVLEIIAPPIPGIAYGDRVDIEYNPLEIAVTQ